MNIFKKLTGLEEKEARVRELTAICHLYEFYQKTLVNDAKHLYKERKRYSDDILSVQKHIRQIANLPTWFYDDLEDSVSRIKDFRLAVEYEINPQKFAEATDKTGRTAAFIGAGTATGAAIATFGSTAAMSVATVLGTASTGTAISALSGVAATNAALAWLGGGAIAAGGSGVAGGTLLLGMFGPIGIAIAGVSSVGGLFFLRKKNREKMIEIEQNSKAIKQDTENLKKKINRLSDLIARSDNNYKMRLQPQLKWVLTVLPKDYAQWDDDQKHQLEKLLNAVSLTAQLINERI